MQVIRRYGHMFYGILDQFPNAWGTVFGLFWYVGGNTFAHRAGFDGGHTRPAGAIAFANFAKGCFHIRDKWRSGARWFGSAASFSAGFFRPDRAVIAEVGLVQIGGSEESGGTGDPTLDSAILTQLNQNGGTLIIEAKWNVESIRVMTFSAADVLHGRAVEIAFANTDDNVQQISITDEDSLDFDTMFIQDGEAADEEGNQITGQAVTIRYAGNLMYVSAGHTEGQMMTAEIATPRIKFTQLGLIAPANIDGDFGGAIRSIALYPVKTAREANLLLGYSEV